jgi:hypothetical protein
MEANSNMQNKIPRLVSVPASETENGQHRSAGKPDASGTTSPDNTSVLAALEAVRRESLIRSTEIETLKSMIESQRTWFEHELSRYAADAKASHAAANLGAYPSQKASESRTNDSMDSEIAELKSLIQLQHTWFEQELKWIEQELIRLAAEANQPRPVGDTGRQTSETPSGSTASPLDPLALIRKDFDTRFRTTEWKMEAMRTLFVEKVSKMVEEQNRAATDFSGYVQKVSGDLQIVANELRAESAMREAADASNKSRVDEVTKILQDAIAKDSEDMNAMYALVNEAMDKSEAAKREVYSLGQQLDSERSRVLLLERRSQFLNAAINSPQGTPLPPVPQALHGGAPLQPVPVPDKRTIHDT